jgi:hypothetical protein
MMGPRWLVLPLAVLTGCATGPAPRMLSADLHIGGLDDRTSFELDDSSTRRRSAATDEGDDLDDLDEPVDTPKQQRIRRLLYLTGLGALGFGIVGTVGFGIGGRIVQAQLKHGYQDGDLTHAREDQLSTTGTAMNVLANTSAVIGLAGVITAAAVYGVDHARCGNLRPRRKQCAERDPKTGVLTVPADEGVRVEKEGTTPKDASGASDEGGGSGIPGGSSDAANDAGGSSPGAVSSVEASPTGGATEPAAIGPSPAGSKSSSGGKRASSPGTKAGQ